MQWGMNDVDTCWNGLSTEYDVQMGDSFMFSEMNKGYTAEVRVPGLPVRQVAQVMGSAELPPFKSSAGFCEPEVPNPFSEQRDASYALDYDVRFAYRDDLFPTENWWTSHERIPLDPAPVAEPAQEVWGLKMNDTDLESMFVDYFSEPRRGIH